MREIELESDPKPSVPGKSRGAVWAGIGIGLVFVLLQVFGAQSDPMVGMAFGVLGMFVAGAAAALTFAAHLVDRLASRACVNRGVEEFSRAMGVLAIAGCLQVPGCVATCVLGEIRIHRAQLWCEDLLPKLDSYREQHGHYPATLLELGIPVPPSDYTHVNGLYSTHEDAFGFDLSDGGMFSGWSMSSSNRTWRHYH